MVKFMICLWAIGLIVHFTEEQWASIKFSFIYNITTYHDVQQCYAPALGRFYNCQPDLTLRQLTTVSGIWWNVKSCLLCANRLNSWRH